MMLECFRPHNGILGSECVRILQAQWFGVILILKLCANLNSVHSPGVNCCTADTRILQRPGLMCWKMRKVFTPKWFGVLDESGLYNAKGLVAFAGKFGSPLARGAGGWWAAT